jgi:hypothetical protein
MDAALRFVTEVTRATRVERGRAIQSLWGGYGELFRVELDGADVASVIVKWVKPPHHRLGRHRGGAENERSHARKCRSYDVETAWYRTYASQCDATCRVPKLLGSRAGKDEWLLILEDLDAAGFGVRARRETGASLEVCLGWLASFHARFLGAEPTGLWKTGTYWHLATRPDELAVMEDDALRAAAPALDRMLSTCRFKTFVHGDAKLPNFCFSPAGDAVAAVDFQYVGGGCGMKDVAYLIAGDPAESRHLDYYFARLREHVDGARSFDGSALEEEWRALYPIACVDFYRFLAGWAKDAWRRDHNGQRVARTVLASLRPLTAGT